MGSLNSQHLVLLLTTYGYWAVLFLVLVESTGIPVPGETMLLIASVYAGTTHHLHGILVVVAALTGAVLGDNIGFLLGRLGGYHVLHRYGKYVRLDERKLGLGQYLFHRHGGKVVFFGRFVPVLRMWAAFLGGANRMSWQRFLLCNAGGGLLWASFYGVGGYTLGNTMTRLGGPIALTSMVLATLVTVCSGIVLRRKERQLECEAEQAGFLQAA